MAQLFFIREAIKYTQLRVAERRSRNRENTDAAERNMKASIRLLWIETKTWLSKHEHSQLQRKVFRDENKCEERFESQSTVKRWREIPNGKETPSDKEQDNQWDRCWQLFGNDLPAFLLKKNSNFFGNPSICLTSTLLRVADTCRTQD